MACSCVAAHLFHGGDFGMSVVIQQIVTGLSIGGVYALLAVGYALIYSVFDFSNFAFGCVMMVSAFVAYYSILAGCSVAMGIALAIAVGILFSVFIELIAYRPLRKKNTSRLFLMITGIGIDMAVTNTAVNLLGANYRPFPNVSVTEPIMMGNIAVGKIDIIALIVSLVALGILWVFLEKTKPGLAIRASAYDTSTAGIMGINVNQVSIIVFVISGVVAAIAGIFFGMKYAIYPSMGTVSTKAFIASVIGGLGNLEGAVIGGIILGLLETFVSGYISSTYRDLFSYGLLILVLLFMPGGLLAKSKSDKL